MAYARQTWANGAPSGGLTATSQVNAERLSYMEDGIEAATAATDGQFGIERFPPGGLIVVDKVKAFYGAANAWPASRPTARTDLVILWLGDTDPGAIAIGGDIIDLVG